MPTTHIIDWGTTQQLPLKIVTSPDPIYPGDSIKISLYSAYQYELTSPYGGLSAKKLAVEARVITEIIELSGVTDISAEYPIANVISITAVIDLVTESIFTQATQEPLSIAAHAGMPVNALLRVVNQQLKVNNLAIKLHGSIRLIYKTFPEQSWTHSGFQSAGNVKLSAKNLTSGAYQVVSVLVSARSVNTSGIKIEAYPMPPHIGLYPYASFIEGVKVSV